MQKTGENKAMGSGETKGLVMIKYVGHQEEQYVSEGPSWPKTTFKRGVPVAVGATLAEELLKQTAKFQPAGKEA